LASVFVRAGATQAVCPPGWNGSPSSRDHRRTNAVTVSGSVAAHSRRSSASRLTASARFWGIGNEDIANILPSCSSCAPRRVDERRSGS